MYGFVLEYSTGMGRNKGPVPSEANNHSENLMTLSNNPKYDDHANDTQ